MRQALHRGFHECTIDSSDSSQREHQVVFDKTVLAMLELAAHALNSHLLVNRMIMSRAALENEGVSRSEGNSRLQISGRREQRDRLVQCWVK